MHEVQVNLAIMQNVVQNPMVAIDSFSKKVAALPLKDRLATTKATAMRTVIDSLGVPSQVYSEDGTEFNQEFKQLPNLCGQEGYQEGGVGSEHCLAASEPATSKPFTTVQTEQTLISRARPRRRGCRQGTGCEKGPGIPGTGGWGMQGALQFCRQLPC